MSVRVMSRKRQGNGSLNDSGEKENWRISTPLTKRRKLQSPANDASVRSPPVVVISDSDDSDDGWTLKKLNKQISSGISNKTSELFANVGVLSPIQVGQQTRENSVPVKPQAQRNATSDRPTKFHRLSSLQSVRKSLFQEKGNDEKLNNIISHIRCSQSLNEVVHIEKVDVEEKQLFCLKTSLIQSECNRNSIESTGSFLIVKPRKLSYHVAVGPFEPVSLVICENGNYEVKVYYTDTVDSGTVEIDNVFKVVSLVKDVFMSSYTLCPGLVGIDSQLFSLGQTFLPNGIVKRDFPWKRISSKKCSVWHKPSSQVLSHTGLIDVDNNDENLTKQVCKHCREVYRCVKRDVNQLSKTRKREERQQTSSKYPFKLLSPTSQRQRMANLRKENKKLKRQVKLHRKRTRVNVSNEQNSELIKLIQEIENSEAGIKELESVVQDANNENQGQGDILKEVWLKDSKEAFFRDQRKNGNGKKGNRWSSTTIRIALAIYTRSPSSYTAVRDLNILQLPCIDILRKCIKKDSEAAGIDDEYLFKEHERYKAYVKSRRTAGFPEPLGTGVLIWDEVKVQMKIVANFKNGEVLGWAMTPQEMSQLHDIFEDITDKQENSKVRYVLQFLWRDLTSAFDLIGPYFTCQASVTTSALSEMVNQTMYALHKFCFKVCAMVCDGASTNLALLKILCGLPNKMLDINDCEGGNIRERYHKNFCFRNPFDVDDHPVFVIVCPSHQLKNMIAALCSSSRSGSKTKSFIKDDVTFGWDAIEAVYSKDITRAEQGLARLVPGLKYSYVYRDNWTRLNVRPAKIMQQRYMISALRKLEVGQDDESSNSTEQTTKFLEACYLIFEKGILSHMKITDDDSTPLKNIREGMKFFEEWAYEHENRDYVDNSAKARQKHFLAWQTWDLLRIMAYGMLDFCEWFTAAFPKHHGYYLVPLRTNGSAFESIFSCLKFRAGGNLSGANYGQILGRVIKKRELDHNPNTERSYRGINLNISGSDNASTNLPATLASRTTAYPEICTIRHFNFVEYQFPSQICQSSMGDRNGSNACTFICLYIGQIVTQNSLQFTDGRTLPSEWTSAIVNSIVSGNDLHDKVFNGDATDIDVEEAVSLAESINSDLRVEDTDQPVYFVERGGYRALQNEVQRATNGTQVGLIITNGQTSIIIIFSSGDLMYIDTHSHKQGREFGALALSFSADDMDDFTEEFVEQHTKYVRAPTLGALTWVHYNI